MVEDPESGRLASRPCVPGHRTELPPAGSHTLSVGSTGQAWLRAADPAPPAGAVPLLVALHGAGGHAVEMLTMVGAAADRHGVLVLAPQSTLGSWDVIQGGYGPDVRVIDQALAQVFDRYDIDPTRVAVGGFSDGASYALSLGIANGDLFGHVLAWSPGFAAPVVEHGRARIYVSHGGRDRVLPVDRCSRRLVPRLRSSGYDVLYEEFDGPHTVPPEVLERSMTWFVSGPGDGSPERSGAREQ